MENEDLIRRHIQGKTPGITDEQLDMFLLQCERTKLDPLQGQIHPVMRWNNKANRHDLTVQIGISGARLIALRTKKYKGRNGPFFCGSDGKWVDVWLSATPPVAAKVEILRDGFDVPIVEVVRYESVVQRDRSGKPNMFWHKRPDGQLGKCTEIAGLRSGFPQEMSGLYLEAEMFIADDEKPQPQKRQEQPKKQENEQSKEKQQSKKKVALPDTTKEGWKNLKVGFSKTGDLTWQQMANDVPFVDGSSSRYYLQQCAECTDDRLARVAQLALEPTPKPIEKKDTPQTEKDNPSILVWENYTIPEDWLPDQMQGKDQFITFKQGATNTQQIGFQNSKGVWNSLRQFMAYSWGNEPANSEKRIKSDALRERYPTEPKEMTDDEAAKIAAESLKEQEIAIREQESQDKLKE